MQQRKTQGLEAGILNVLSCLSVTCWQMLFFFHHNTLTAQLSHHFFLGSGSQTKPGSAVMFKCILTFLSYKQSAEFRLQNAFYFHGLHRMEGSSETHENVLRWRILLMLSGPSFRVLAVLRRRAGWVSSPGKAVLCGMWLVS